MKYSIEIFDELNTISPLLAEMEKTNVFTAPHGYFDDLSALILSAGRDEECRDLFLQNPGINKDIPLDYFNNLASDILSKIKEQENEIPEELHPQLLALQQINVYEVPAHYFENLAETILSKLNNQNSSEEILSLSPLMHSIQKENVFSVSGDYFNNFSTEILNKVHPTTAKVIRMSISSSLLKYAVAAVFTGIMALGAFKITSVNTSIALTTAQINGLKIADDNRFEEEFAKVSDDEIVSFLTKDGVNVDDAIAFTQMQEKATMDETTNSSEINEIDELFNQIENTKSMN